MLGSLSSGGTASRARQGSAMVGRGTQWGLELHGFADAFERAYAAVIYLRIIDEDGIARVSLVSAKIRVASIKPLSLLRLELCAAGLLAALASQIKVVLDLKDVPVHLWSDSTAILAWIRGHPARWKTWLTG